MGAGIWVRWVGLRTSQRAQMHARSARMAKNTNTCMANINCIKQTNKQTTNKQTNNKQTNKQINTKTPGDFYT